MTEPLSDKEKLGKALASIEKEIHFYNQEHPEGDGFPADVVTRISRIFFDLRGQYPGNQYYPEILDAPTAEPENEGEVVTLWRDSRCSFLKTEDRIHLKPQHWCWLPEEIKSKHNIEIGKGKSIDCRMLLLPIKEKDVPKECNGGIS